jgi:RNA polymerase sigma-70 factor, ECF subfamily
MTLPGPALPGGGGEAPAFPEAEAGSDRARLERMAEECFQFIWRSLRRLGVTEASVDDGAQRVFEIATLKLSKIRPGSERAFLFNTAVRVASGMRRRDFTRRESGDDGVLDALVDPGPHPEEATEWKQRRELLDELLAAMPMDLRTVFVLFELEGLPTIEIALLLDIPAGTAASRLRRAREHFEAQVKRLRAQRAPTQRQP